MREKYKTTLQELHMDEMVEVFSARNKYNVTCGMFPFEFNSAIDMIWHYNSHNGKFNGTLDGGLTGEDIKKMHNMKVKDIIDRAVEVMLGNVDPTDRQ